MKGLRHPVRAIREPFGTAGLIVACIAIVLAFTGAAFAAGALTGKQKKEVEKIAKKYAGKPGAPGAAGPQGPAGVAGKDGAAGANGAAGATGPTGPKGNVGPAGAVGEEGPTGPTGPAGSFGGTGLPEGATETGYWSFRAPGFQMIKDGDGNMVEVGDSEVIVPISFPERLPQLTPAAFQTRFQLTDPEFSETCGTGPNGVGGKVSEPKAPPETLCVWAFLGTVENATFGGFNERPDFGGGFELTSRGTSMKFTVNGEGPAFGGGSWALSN